MWREARRTREARSASLHGHALGALTSTAAITEHFDAIRPADAGVSVAGAGPGYPTLRFLR